MRGIWLFIKWLTFVVVALIGFMFAVENSQQLPVDFLLFTAPSWSAGVWLLIFLGLGCLSGIVVSTALIAHYKRQLKLARRELHKTRTGASNAPVGRDVALASQ